MLLAFLVANPYALLDRHQFIDDLRKQTETAAGDEGGGKLGLARHQRLVVLPADVHVGLRLAAVAARRWAASAG